MKEIFFYTLFWMLSAGLNATDKVEAIVQQKFSKPHATRVKESASARLKEIDVSNPLFILK
jgi:hypothetical protein